MTPESEQPAVAARRENLTREEAAARSAALSGLAYDVELDLTRGDEVFEARTRVRFTAATAEPTFVDCSAVRTDRVELNGEPVVPDAVTGTRIRLDGVRAGDNELLVSSTMAYQHEGRGLHFFRDPTDDNVYLHSQFEPFDAHLVYPCFDQPDLKATFDFRVEAPAGWVVVSNMAATAQPDTGQPGLWRFETTPRIPTYITAVVAGAYAVSRDRHGETELGIYVRRSLADYLNTDELFTLTRQGLGWYERVFDMPYPFGKYDQLFVPEFSAGAMENPGAVTFSESYVFRSRVTDAARERRAETILHEMAHMWFGDLVTMRWFDDLWLNESFATFMSVLCQTEATRWTDGWVTFLDAEKAWAKFQDQLPSTHAIADEMPDVESVHQNFDGITYAKGASVLRQLVAWVGQDAFLEGCRRYFAKHAYDNAELADFLAALEDASGRDLDAWSAEWLRTTGLNRLAVDYRIGDDAAFKTFTILQEAPETASGSPGTLRRHRLAVGVYARTPAGLTRTAHVELDVDGQRTDVAELVGTPAGDMVLVNDDDLTYAKTTLDERTTRVLTTELHRLVDPLARALAWSSTWDMVRDAELPARTFVELVTNNVHAADAAGRHRADETEVGVLQRLLARALGAAERYGDPGHRQELLAALADHARAALEDAAAGSDHQLAWVRHWAACSRQGSELTDVVRVLEGELTFTGLEVDTDLRWHLLTCLARSGAVTEARIDAELTRDQTDLGQRHAATANAARPDRDAKQRAWQRLVDDAALSHTMSRQLWAGFNQIHQAEVLAPYTRRYFDALADVWAHRSLDWAIEFSEGMFPHHAASPELLETVDGVLDDETLTRPLRRVLREERDTLVRTLRARELDAGA